MTNVDYSMTMQIAKAKKAAWSHGRKSTASMNGRKCN